MTVEVAGPQPEVRAEGQGLFANTIEVSILPLEARGAKAQQGTPQRSEAESEAADRAGAWRRPPCGCRRACRCRRAAISCASRARETGGGLTGSVFYDLEVPDYTKKKFAMSGARRDRRHRRRDADGGGRPGAQGAAARAADDPPRVLRHRQAGALRRGLRHDRRLDAAHRRHHHARDQRGRQGSGEDDRGARQQGAADGPRRPARPAPASATPRRCR